MSKDRDGFLWWNTGMNEFGEIPFIMNCIGTSYSEVAEPLSNLADVREERRIETKVLTVDNVSKDGPSLMASLRITALPAFKFDGVVIEVSDEPSCAAAFLRLDQELAKSAVPVAGLDVEYVTYIGRDQPQGAECNHNYADLAQVCVGPVCVLIFFDAPAATEEAKAALYAPFQHFLANSRIKKVISYYYMYYLSKTFFK